MSYCDLDDMDRMSVTSAKYLIGCYTLMFVGWIYFIIFTPEGP